MGWIILVLISPYIFLVYLWYQGWSWRRRARREWELEVAYNRYQSRRTYNNADGRTLH
jgi:hypothetical protein